MKKKFLALFIAVVSAVAVFAFAGCDNDNPNTPDDADKDNQPAEVSHVTITTVDEQKCAIFTASNDVLKIGNTTSVSDYLNALKTKNELTFESQTGDYGLFITSIDGTANVDNADHTGYSWMIYIDFTTLENDEAIYGSDFSTFTYENKTLYSSNNGVSGTPCVEGHTYAFVYEYYDYSAWY